MKKFSDGTAGTGESLSQQQSLCSHFHTAKCLCRMDGVAPRRMLTSKSCWPVNVVSSQLSSQRVLECKVLARQSRYKSSLSARKPCMKLPSLAALVVSASPCR